MSSSSFIIVSSTISTIIIIIITIIIITISSFSCRWELGGGGYYFWIYLLVREVSNFIEKATENKFLLILSLFDAMPALWYYHPLIAYGTHPVADPFT